MSVVSKAGHLKESVLQSLGTIAWTPRGWTLKTIRCRWGGWQPASDLPAPVLPSESNFICSHRVPYLPCSGGGSGCLGTQSGWWDVTGTPEGTSGETVKEASDAGPHPFCSLCFSLSCLNHGHVDGAICSISMVDAGHHGASQRTVTPTDGKAKSQVTRWAAASPGHLPLHFWRQKIWALTCLNYYYPTYPEHCPNAIPIQPTIRVMP